MGVYDSAIREELQGKEDVIGSMIGTEDLCSSTLFWHIDRQLANIGVGEVVPLPGSGKERLRIHGAVTDYVHVLGPWLHGRTPDETMEMWPPSVEVARRIYRVLGDSTALKRWLVACLWKKLLENQAHHGRGAIDEDPARFALPLEALALEVPV